MPNRAPAFQFFAADWFDIRVMRMNFFSQGVYIRILAHMWKDSKDQCSISSNLNEMEHVLSLSTDEVTRVFGEIQWPGDPILVEKEGRFISRRLQRTKRQMVENRRAKAAAGKKGAAVTNSRRGSADFLPPSKSASSTATATASSDVVKTTGRGKGGDVVVVLSPELKALTKPGEGDKAPDGIKAYEILTSIGLKRGHRNGKAWKLALCHPLGRIKEVALMCTGKRNPAGFVLKALENGWGGNGT